MPHTKSNPIRGFRGMKKVLIITYYWPPAGGPGVQRWLKFVKYLPDFGVEPIVYCPENPSYPLVDESLVDEIPKNITILKQPIKEPYRLANFLSGKKAKQISSGVIPKKKKQSLIQRLMLYIRGNYFIPDARKNWVNPSVAFLSRYIEKNGIETIITTGPPHSLHLIGLKLKQTFNLKWIADFRDPWTSIGYHKQLKLNKSSEEKHKHIESQVLTTADQIIVTSSNTKKEFINKTVQPVSIITNGYDTIFSERPPKDEKFTMAHIGSLLSERNPQQLWQAISELVKENSDFKNKFQLKFIGVTSEDVLKSLNDFGLTSFIQNSGYMSHKDALTAQMTSRVLLLIEIDSQDTKVIIPGKLFEYMIAETPILAIGPRQSDVETIMLNTKTGHYFYYDQKHQIKSQILTYFENYQSNTLKVNPMHLERYSRRELTRALARII